jgi:very-short-patch-repair endonuclease
VLIEELIRRAGGSVSTAELHEAGIGRAELARLLREGRLWRARQGWYVARGTAPAVVRAVRVGGVLTCARALEAHSLWSSPQAGMHVRVHHSSCRLRTPRDSRRRLAAHPDSTAVVHWSPGSADSTRILAGPLDALDDYFACADRDHALGSLDSLILLDRRRASALCDRFGVREWEGVDGGCESGIETIFYVRMLRLGVFPHRQVPLPGVGRVDFLVGRSLVVEVDGRSFHDVEASFESDRSRDAGISGGGRRSLRFSHDQVLNRWVEVERAVLGALARGDHL